MRPGKAEAPADDTAQGIGDQGTEPWHFATEAEHRQAAAEGDRRITALQAQLALRGFELIILDRPGSAVYCVGRWGLLKELDDLDAVEQFAERVGVTS